MRELMYREALREALDEEMAREPTVFIIGEGIAERGGSYKVTEGLLAKYGPGRVRDTPIAEAGMIGVGVGAAIAGARPVVEILYVDFAMLGMDMIVNQAAKFRLMTGGEGRVPFIMRTQGGTGGGVAAQHSQSLEALFYHIPGLRVVMPSTPADAKGLLKYALRQDDPVMFLEHKHLYMTKGMVPEENSLSTFVDKVAQALEKALGFKIPVAAIGGPCIAGELAVRRTTGTVIVAHDLALVTKLCENLQTDYYQPRPSIDVIGVETCAAFKNFFAISVGWAHGALDRLPSVENNALNNNAAAILFDQAIREMMVLAQNLGGSAESVWGMPGAGDLYVTCQAGRNSRLGQHLGRGLTYSEVKQGPMKEDTVEGAELGLSVASALHAMIRSGKLRGENLPLTLALLNALQHNTSFNPPWGDFHRSS